MPEKKEQYVNVYIDSTLLRKKINSAIDKHKEEISGWPKPHLSEGEKKTITSEYWLAEGEFLDQSFEHVSRRANFGPDRIYKIGPTAREVLSDTLGLIYTIATSSQFPVLKTVWGVSQMVDIVRKIYQGFERIEDPVEKSALETILKLNGKLSVTNYEALRSRNFDKAYGHISPSSQDIIDELSSKFTADQVSAALKELKKREIIGEKEGKLHMIF